MQITKEQDHDRIRQAYGHYRWAEVRHPYNMGRAEMKKIGVPLPNDPSLISVPSLFTSSGPIVQSLTIDLFFCRFWRRT